VEVVGKQEQMTAKEALLLWAQKVTRGYVVLWLYIFYVNLYLHVFYKKTFLGQTKLAIIVLKGSHFAQCLVLIKPHDILSLGYPREMIPLPDSSDFKTSLPVKNNLPSGKKFNETPSK